MPRYTPEQALEHAIEKADAALTGFVAKRDALYLERVALIEKIDAVIENVKAAIDRKNRAQQALAMMRGEPIPEPMKEDATATVANEPTTTRRASADESPKEATND